MNEKANDKGKEQQEMLLGHKVRMISVGIDKYMHRREVTREALPKGQGPICGYILRNGDRPVFQKDLEKAFHVSGATVSNSLRNMEENGIIERIPMPEDARLKRIVVTEKGIAFHEKDFANICRMEETMKKGFTEEELKLFREYLDRAAQNLREMD